MLMLKGMVVLVELKHALQFVLRGGFSLSKNRLLDLGVSVKVVGAIVDALDRGCMHIDAKLSESLV